MKKTYRYFIYLGIGVVLYFFLKKDEGNPSLDKIHENAPAIILSVIVILLVLNFIKTQREKKR